MSDPIYVPPYYVEIERAGMFARSDNPPYAGRADAETTAESLHCETHQDTQVVDSQGALVLAYGVYYPCPGDLYGDPFYVDESEV